MAFGSVNVPGGSTQGADGKSAYEVAVANGFSGTEAQWLASLKGETGATGAQGPKGDTGPQGPVGPGIDASTFRVVAGQKEGENLGYLSTAEGGENIASGRCSHAEGHNNTSFGIYSHAEGQGNTASSTCSHVEGQRNTASGWCSHAEGENSIASDRDSHAENCGIASGPCSHAEGEGTASAACSHAEGCETIASNDSSHAGGEYNKEMVAGDIFVLGYGTNYARKNIFRITTAGAVYGLSAFNSTGADYAEFFEWQDGNPDKEDRVGRFVTLDGEKVRFAGSEDDFILGIVSGNPSVVGDAFEDQWNGQYEMDIYGRPINEELTIPAKLDGDGNVIIPERKEIHQKLSPKYDSTQEYIRRSDRPEWTVVGMMGKLTVIDDGTCQVNGWCTVGAGGVATASESRTKYRVMSRLDGNHIRVLIL